MNRRGFLTGLGLVAAPAVIRLPGLLMPVRSWHNGIRGEIRWVPGRRFNGLPLYPVVPVISDGRRWHPFRYAGIDMTQPGAPWLASFAPVDGPAAICA